MLSRLPGKVSGCDVALVWRARREKFKNVKIHFENRKVADTTESFPVKLESCGYVCALCVNAVFE